MTSSSVALTGSIVALITPMHEDGSVDYPALRKLIDWHVAEGTDCIGVVGTTGESPTVNVEEHCEIIRVSVEQAAGRVPVMAGCGANSDRCKLIVLNNPNNPTGALMTAPFLKEVTRIAEGAGAWILCDEVYRGLEHEPGASTPSIVDLYERGVATGSLSKVFSLAGLRLGWVAGPGDFIRDCFVRRDYTTISCGMIDEMLALRAFSFRDRILGRNLPLVRKNAAILDRWVLGETGLSYVPPKAGTTAFIRYGFPIPSEDFCRGLFEFNGAFVVPGKAFDFEGWFRLGFSCSTETLERGLEAISDYLRALRSA